MSPRGEEWSGDSDLWQCCHFSFAQMSPEFLNLETITKTYFLNVKACWCKSISNLIWQDLCPISHPFSDDLLCFEVPGEQCALCLEIFLCHYCACRRHWFALNGACPPPLCSDQMLPHRQACFHNVCAILSSSVINEIWNKAGRYLQAWA